MPFHLDSKGIPIIALDQLIGLGLLACNDLLPTSNRPNVGGMRFFLIVMPPFYTLLPAFGSCNEPCDLFKVMRGEFH